MICKKCGTENPDTFDWCSNCGEMLKKEDVQDFELNSGQEAIHADDIFSEGVPDLSSEYNPYDNATENPTYWQKPKDSKSDVILKRVLGGCGIGRGIIVVLLIILIVTGAVFGNEILDKLFDEAIEVSPSDYAEVHDNEYVELIYTGEIDGHTTKYYLVDSDYLEEFEEKCDYTGCGHFYFLKNEPAKISTTYSKEPVIGYIDIDGNSQTVYVCGTYASVGAIIRGYNLNFSTLYVNVKTDVPADEAYATEVYFIKEETVESSEKEDGSTTHKAVDDNVFETPEGVVYKLSNEVVNDKENSPYTDNPCGIIVEVNVLNDNIIEIETDEGKIIKFINKTIADKNYDRKALLGYDAFVSGYRVDSTTFYADVVYLLETDVRTYMDI